MVWFLESSPLCILPSEEVLALGISVAYLNEVYCKKKHVSIREINCPSGLLTVFLLDLLKQAQRPQAPDLE